VETADDSKVNGKVSVVVVDSPEHGRSSAARPQQQTSEKRADRRVPPRGSTLPLGYVSDYINRGALAEAQHLAPAPLSVEVAVGRWGWHRGRATRCGWRRLRCTGKLPLAAADGAGVLVLQPRVDAHEVEVVRTLRTPSARVLRAGVRCAQGRPVTLGRRRTLPQTTGESSPGPGAPGAQPSSAMWQIPHTSSSEVQVQLATAAAHAHPHKPRQKAVPTQACGVRTMPVLDLDLHLVPTPS
jgi:hypothetical protein